MPPAAFRPGDDRMRLVLAALLAGLATIGPFTIDTYMPSFPSMARSFAVDAVLIQQTLPAYLIPFAFMTLFHGTLSDAFGRRPVILVGLAVFALASVGCAFAQSLNQMLAFRALQGMSAGVGMVVGRAMIRDLYSGHDAQRVMSMVTMIFGLAPAIAPVIGGWFETGLGWRSIFVFLALFAGALLVACRAALPESLPPEKRHPFAARPLLAAYAKLLGSARFVLLVSAIAFNFSGFFLYIVSAPAVIYDLLGLGATQFAWLFVPGISGVVFGAFLSGRLAGRLSARRTVALGYAIMGAAVCYNVGYHSFFPPALPWTVLAVMLYTIGMSLAMPSLTLLALDLFPHNRGLAASLQGGQQSLFSGITAGVLSPLLATSALKLGIGAMVLMLCGLACTLAYTRTTRASDSHA